MTPGRNGIIFSLTGWDIMVLATLAVVLGIGLVPAHWRVEYNQQLLTPTPPALTPPVDPTPTLPPTPGTTPVDTPTLPPTSGPTPTATTTPIPPPPDTPTPTTPPIEILEADLQLGVAVTVQSKLITYTVTITNRGPTNPVTASVVNMFSLPPAVISAGGAGCDPYTGGPITCTVGNMLLNTPATLILTATIHPDFPGPLTNTVTLTDTGDVINTNPNNSVAVRAMIEPSPTHRPTPPPEPQPCPVRLLGPENFFSFTSSDSVALTWASPGGLAPDEHYRLSFRTVDESRELNALLTKNSFSIKPSGVDHWIDDQGDWLSDVVENGQYLWTVAVVRGDTLVCEASEKRVITWILPP